MAARATASYFRSTGDYAPAREMHELSNATANSLSQWFIKGEENKAYFSETKMTHTRTHTHTHEEVVFNISLDCPSNLL